MSELAAPSGVCLQTSQEAAAQGGRGQTGSLRGGVRRSSARGAAHWRKDILCRRGPFPGGRRVAGQVGAAGRASPPSTRGQALVDSSSPRYGEKASYYSAVCLETGEVEWMELEGNSNSGSSTAFLMQLREGHDGPLNVIWDNAPAHRGEAMREYLQTPGLHLRLVNPCFHEGRLCRATVRTSTPTRRSGAGRERRRRATCAWGARPQCRRGLGASLLDWPAGKTT